MGEDINIIAQCHAPNGFKGARIDGSWNISFDVFPSDVDGMQKLIPFFAKETLVHLTIKEVDEQKTGQV